MNYRLRWRRRAKDELADVWLRASDKSTVTRAAHQLEVQLRRDPYGIGESRSGAVRYVFEGPLAMLVEIVGNEVRVITVGESNPNP